MYVETYKGMKYRFSLIHNAIKTIKTDKTSTVQQIRGNKVLKTYNDIK